MKREDYIKELEECLENHSKIDETLGRTKELKEYLKGMGISDEYTESAGVVEIIKNKLKGILLLEECKISETGIDYSEGEFKVNEDGSINVSDEEKFELPDENENITFHSESNIISENIVINNLGAIISDIEISKSPYAVSYSEVRRNDKKNTITIEATDSSTYEVIEEKPDNGSPITLGSLVDFELDYNRLVREFPKIKQWYDLKYPNVNGDKNKFEEIRKNTENEIEQKKIDELEKEINEELKLIAYYDKILIDKSERYQLMVDSISKIGEKSTIGKKVSKMLMKKVNNQILERNDAKTQEKEKTEDISKDKKEERIFLEKRLKDLRKLVSKKEKDSINITVEIKKLEEQIKKIPLFGKSIIKKSKKIQRF